MKKAFMGVYCTLMFTLLTFNNIYGMSYNNYINNQENISINIQSSKTVIVLDEIFGNVLNVEGGDYLQTCEKNGELFCKFEDVIKIGSQYGLQYDTNFNYNETAINNEYMTYMYVNGEKFYNIKEISEVLDFGFIYNNRKDFFVMYIDENDEAIKHKEEHYVKVLNAIVSNEVVDESYQTDSLVNGDLLATIETTKGDVTIKLLKQYAPKTVENFITLSMNDYYNGMTFSTAIEELFIQSEINNNINEIHNFDEVVFEEEFNKNARHYTGAVAMLNDEFGSFYFIPNYSEEKTESTINDLINIVKDDDSLNMPVNIDIYLNFVRVKDIITPNVFQTYCKYGGEPHLDFEYTVFAQIVNGQEIIDEIFNNEVNEKNKTLNEVSIKDIIIYEYNEM